MTTGTLVQLSLELRSTSEEGLEEDGGDGTVGFYQVSKHAGHALDISCGHTWILIASLSASIDRVPQRSELGLRRAN